MKSSNTIIDLNKINFNNSINSAHKQLNNSSALIADKISQLNFNNAANMNSSVINSKSINKDTNNNNNNNNNFYKISIEEMWRHKNKDDLPGIKEYNLIKKYVDPKKQIEDRNYNELSKKVEMKKAKFDRMKKFDKDGNVIIPNRNSFIDQIIYKEKKRNEKPTDDKNIELFEKYYPPYVKKSKNESMSYNTDKHVFKKLYAHDRKTFAEELFMDLKKSYEITNEEKKELIEKVIDKHDLNNYKKISPVEKINERYHNKGSISKSTRLSVIDDSLWQGEQSAFYNKKYEEEETTKVNGLVYHKNEFFPNKVLPSSPKWKWIKKKPYNEEEDKIKEKNDKMEERVNQIKENWERKNFHFIDDVVKSYNLVKNKGRYFPTLKKPIEKTEQYMNKIESSPLKHPSPNTYFKSKKEVYPHNYGKKRRVKVDDDEENKYIVDRSKIDKRINKVYKSYIF